MKVSLSGTMSYLVIEGRYKQSESVGGDIKGVVRFMGLLWRSQKWKRMVNYG